MNSVSNPSDLTVKPPRSPRARLGGYIILGRAIDKCRALLNGNIGEYHFDCPLDNVLFSFKVVSGEDLKKQVAKGLSDEQIVQWLNSSGTSKTPEEIRAWADKTEALSLYAIPEKREYFAAECKKLGLNPATTTTFTWLEADDRASVGV